MIVKETGIKGNIYYAKRNMMVATQEAQRTCSASSEEEWIFGFLLSGSGKSPCRRRICAEPWRVGSDEVFFWRERRHSYCMSSGGSI